MTFQRGERPALVRGDPHVDHRVLSAGVDGRGRAVAFGVGQPDDDRFAGVVQPPAEVLVDVPLHEPSAEVDELRIVDGLVLGDEHRGHERALVTIDGVHEGLRLRRVEERVVEDVAHVDVVLVPGARVADRPVAERRERRDVGELRELVERRLHQGLGAGLLLGRHARHTGEVDRLRRIPRPRPSRGRRGRRRVVGVLVRGRLLGVVTVVARRCLGSGCLVAMGMGGGLGAGLGLRTVLVSGGGALGRVLVVGSPTRRGSGRGSPS